MELLSGFPLLLQQYKSLLKKNLLLSWRNKRATLLQILSPLIFIFLIFAVDKAIRPHGSASSAYKSVTDPPAMPIPSITPCEQKFFIKHPCYDFVWSGNQNPKFHTIVDRIMNNNPDRPIPASKVKSFKDKVEVDAWLFNNPMRCPGALHFMERNDGVISYGLQINSIVVPKRGQYEDLTDKFQLSLQLAAEREIARYLIGDPNFSWNVFLKEFAHPAKPLPSSVGVIGLSFFLAIAMFNFVLQMSSLVTEKELKLRQAMSMMGLYDSAYWLSWLTWEALITLISSILIILFGMMFRFLFFVKNSFGILFFLFFLFELSMTSLAFMLSAFIRKSSSATTVGFSIFIVGFVTQITVVAGVPYSEDYSKAFLTSWSFFPIPPNPFAQGIRILSMAVGTLEDHGIRWSKRGECTPSESSDCWMTINDIYKWLLATFFLWFVMVIYFDNIIPNSSGVRKSIFYFLYPSYWLRKGGEKVKEGGICSRLISGPHEEHNLPDDEDVLQEENNVKQKLGEGVVDANVAVQIHGLSKTYPSTLNIGCCCKCKRTPPYNALKSLIYGHSIRSPTGMSNIRKLIGVCPQFDILWDALSGEEHLQLFASIKGLSPTSIKSITQTSLGEVRLTEASNVRAGSYSGGMRRRLSVAIALIGDPKLVILDEPTTGMDPITRRHVWDIIQNAKRGRAIILTTHSMEEADILSDRIGIMAKGRLRCIGTSIRLKSRFGAGFIASISFYGNKSNNVDRSSADGDAIYTTHREAVKQFFKNNFFAELQDREEEFGISDIQLGLTTLHEVFLNIAKQEKLESDEAEGSLMTLTLASGESVEIPKGARFVGIPRTESAESPTGYMVKVYWEQDDTGALCISCHSPKVTIPSGIELSSSPAARNSRNLGQFVHGVVIDPSQVSAMNFK